MKKIMLIGMALLCFSCSSYAYDHQILFDNELRNATVTITDLDEQSNGQPSTVTIMPKSTVLRPNKMQLVPLVPVQTYKKSGLTSVETLVKIVIDDGIGAAKQYVIERFDLSESNLSALTCINSSGKSYDIMCYSTFMNGLSTYHLKIQDNEVTITDQADY